MSRNERWLAGAVAALLCAGCTSGEDELADAADGDIDTPVIDSEERDDAVEPAAASDSAAAVPGAASPPAQALEGGAAREADAAARVDAEASAAADGSADANASAERGAAGAAARQRDRAGAGARAEPAEVADVQETAGEYLARRGDSPVDGPGEMDPDAVGAIAVCVVCHGADGEGRPSLNAPRIGGMAEWYLARQLKYFKDGIRAASIDDVHGTQMRAVALTLEDQAAIEDLAAYLATLSPPPAPALTSGDAEHGEELYAVCAACHGEDARGSPELNTPSMIGQDGEYLVRQLEHFKSGVRGMHPSDLFGRQMVPIVQSTLMRREDMVDVVTYMATLGEGGGARGPDSGSGAESGSASDSTADSDAESN